MIADCSLVYCGDIFDSPGACCLFNITALNHVIPSAHTIHMHNQTSSSKRTVHTKRHINTFGKITSLTSTTSKSITLAHTLISLTMIRFKLVTATAMVNQYPNLPTIDRQPRGAVNISLWETHSKIIGSHASTQLTTFDLEWRTRGTQACMYTGAHWPVCHADACLTVCFPVLIRGNSLL